MSDAPGRPAFLDHLEEGLDRALRDLAGYDHLLVALDFDGVLAPLVDDPADSRIPAQTAAAVAQVAELAAVTLAVVSGREAGDLTALAELPPGTRVVGSHGAQTGRAVAAATGLAFQGEPVALSAGEQELRAVLAEQLAWLVADVEGAWLEEKPASLVVHTRRAAPDDGERLTARVLEGPATLPGVRPQTGKDVVELSVLTRTKGDGIAELRSDAGAHGVLFAGDDVTDEDAFAVLAPPDVGIKVGAGETAAGYRISEPEDIAAVLLRLVELRTSPA